MKDVCQPANWRAPVRDNASRGVVVFDGWATTWDFADPAPTPTPPGPTTTHRGACPATTHTPARVLPPPHTTPRYTARPHTRWLTCAHTHTCCVLLLFPYHIWFGPAHTAHLPHTYLPPHSLGSGSGKPALLQVPHTPHPPPPALLSLFLGHRSAGQAVPWRMSDAFLDHAGSSSPAPRMACLLPRTALHGAACARKPQRRLQRHAHKPACPFDTLSSSDRQVYAGARATCSSTPLTCAHLAVRARVRTLCCFRRDANNIFANISILLSLPPTYTLRSCAATPLHADARALPLTAVSPAAGLVCFYLIAFIFICYHISRTIIFIPYYRALRHACLPHTRLLRAAANSASRLFSLQHLRRLPATVLPTILIAAPCRADLPFHHRAPPLDLRATTPPSLP